MRNYLFSLIACCALIAPFQAAACACADTHTYVDGGYMELPNPPYPEHARLKNEQGIVKLRVRVAPDGSVRHVKLVESSGSLALDRAVREAKFQTAQRGGKPMPTEFDTSFTFLLD
ncbi:energy transducer TonB [Kingella oralis]|uniref:energy transducer TonB n=1 Tax=Kingella oralis TaxID=505 RepID=UPI0034E3D9E4